MALVESPALNPNSVPIDFKLKDTDGKFVTLYDVMDTRGLLVAFICNHCPYVHAKIDRLVATIIKLREYKVGSVAIMSNDVVKYPDDSPVNMAKFKTEHNLPCPYLYDETQDTARAYGAVCTPDLFLFMPNLVYRGRLDSGGKNNNDGDRPELLNAAIMMLEHGKLSTVQHPGIGCSIKWK